MKRKKMVGITFLVFFCVLAIFWISFDFYHMKLTAITEKDVRDVIDSNILVGDEMEEVERFLESKGVKYHQYTEGYRGEVISFNIKDVARSVFIKYHINVKFYFDDSKRLTKYEAEGLGSEDISFKREPDRRFITN